MMVAMRAGDYVLLKDSIWFWANYTIVDRAGATVMTFDMKLGNRLRFDALDAQGRVLLSARGRLLLASNHLAFTRNGEPCATIQAQWKEQRRFVVTCASGDALETRGGLSVAWSLLRSGVEIARVDRRDRRWGIALLDDTQGEFVLCVVMGIVQLTLIDERGLGVD